MDGTALFISRPRRASDLMRPHLIQEETAYVIMDTVCLPEIDYKTFCEDMLADRAFIEKRTALCCERTPLRCLLVTTDRREEGVLVIPGDRGLVKRAAHYCKTR